MAWWQTAQRGMVMSTMKATASTAGSLHDLGDWGDLPLADQSKNEGVGTGGVTVSGSLADV